MDQNIREKSNLGVCTELGNAACLVKEKKRKEKKRKEKNPCKCAITS